MIQPEYLGDAVYASFDGYHIWLHLNDHRSPGLIALEPAVLNRLYEYAQRARDCDPPDPPECEEDSGLQYMNEDANLLKPGRE